MYRASYSRHVSVDRSKAVLSERWYRDHPPRFLVQVDNHFGYIDAKGNLVIAANFEDASRLFAGGLAWIKIESMFGYIDTDGIMRIAAIYTDAYPFVDGYAVVALNGRYGIINDAGDFVVLPMHDMIRNDGNGSFRLGTTKLLSVLLSKISDTGLKYTWTTISLPTIGLSHEMEPPANLLPYRDLDSGLIGFRNQGGDIKIRPQYLASGEYSKSAIRVKLSTGKWTFIDPAGQMLFDRTFTWASDFRDGLAEVGVGSKREYINTAGDTVWP